MKEQITRLTGVAALLALAGALLIGCGGSDESPGTTAEADGTAGGAAAEKSETEGAAGGKTVEIKMGDFFFDPKDATAKVGSTTIEAPNEGSVEHELVLFKTNMDPAKLPTEANGGVDEEKLDKLAEEAGEIADVEANETKSEQFDLTPGKYVMFCNVPGHYAQGMYGTLTVK